MLRKRPKYYEIAITEIAKFSQSYEISKVAKILGLGWLLDHPPSRFEVSVIKKKSIFKQRPKKMDK